MKGILRMITIFLLSVVALAFIFYALGFTLQLIGFSEAVSREGFREALSSEGGSDIEFYASIAWLAWAIIGTYVVPIILGVLAIRYYIKKNKNKS